MNKEHRGQLLVEKEELELQIKRSRAALTKSGDTLTRLGETLKRAPQSLGFFKQGYSLGSSPSDRNFAVSLSFDVANDLDIDKIVSGVVALQEAMDKLGRIERELMSIPLS